MEKLELKHLSPYLPYDLHVEVKCDEEVYRSKLVGFGYFDEKLHALCGDKINNGLYHISGEEYVKPILRPLSDMESDGDINNPQYLQGCCYSYVENLISQHFDVFGLIEKGLAIDINTLYEGI